MINSTFEGYGSLPKTSQLSSVFFGMGGKWDARTKDVDLDLSKNMCFLPIVKKHHFSYPSGEPIRHHESFTIGGYDLSKSAIFLVVHIVLSVVLTVIGKRKVVIYIYILP